MSDVRRDRQLGVLTQGRQILDAPRAADWLDAIDRQVCPLCGKGPFIVVASHVARIHGIYHRELREMLGLSLDETICDPHHSAACSDRFNVSPDEQRERASKRSSKALTDGSARLSRIMSTRRRLIAARFQSGEEMEHIADELGVSRKAVLKALNKEGVSVRNSSYDRPLEMVTFNCPQCGVEATKPAGQIRSNAKQPGYTGPYCSTSCSAKAAAARRANNLPARGVTPRSRTTPRTRVGRG